MDKIVIHTSSWSQYKGAGRIGIARGTPRFGVKAGYKLHKTLAPTREILSANLEMAEYRERYRNEVLANLDPQEQLDLLIEKGQGATPVLLCFEKSPLNDTDNWCHRTMIGEWLMENLPHVEVVEMTPEMLAAAEDAQTGQGALL